MDTTTSFISQVKTFQTYPSEISKEMENCFETGVKKILVEGDVQDLYLLVDNLDGEGNLWELFCDVLCAACKTDEKIKTSIKNCNSGGEARTLLQDQLKMF